MQGQLVHALGIVAFSDLMHHADPRPRGFAAWRCLGCQHSAHRIALRSPSPAEMELLAKIARAKPGDELTGLLRRFDAYQRARDGAARERVEVGRR